MLYERIQRIQCSITACAGNVPASWYKSTLFACMQTVVGGTNLNTDVSRMRRRVPDILVATPGRLLDHLQTQDLKKHVAHLGVLVFDEADRLLDMGFRYARH